jgi:hypothetical protein
MTPHFILWTPDKGVNCDLLTASGSEVILRDFLKFLVHGKLRNSPNFLLGPGEGRDCQHRLECDTPRCRRDMAAYGWGFLGEIDNS